jgi:hypothetical protein
MANNNKPLIDQPMWEQLVNGPANSAAATCVVDDNERFTYWLYSATSFWCYDTWAGTWQQLANPPGGTVAAGSCMRYIKQIGTQLNGKVYGSVYAFLAAGASVTFYKYDIATNAWSAALSVVNIPAAFGTDGRLICPEPMLNGYAGGYHSAVALNTITSSPGAAQGATSITVNALPLALPSGAVLNFGTSAAPVWAVLTASAAASATSITVAALVAAVPAASTAYFYSDMFLFGNNGTVVYRYNFNTALWVLTSANAANPAIPAVTAALGAGHVVCWLPGSGDANALNRFVILRGTATNTIYEYDLVANSFSTVTYYPNTETFTTGTCSGIRQDSNGKSASLLVQKDITGRIFEYTPSDDRMKPKATQYLVTSGAALVGDRMSCLKSTDGVEYLYFMPSTSAYFLRTGLFF